MAAELWTRRRGRALRGRKPRAVGGALRDQRSQLPGRGSRTREGLHHPEQIRDIARQFQNGLSTAGAIVEVHGLRLLAVALGLESRGHRRDASEEQVRHLQARTIASAVEAVPAQVEVDGVIVAGDFNLVVTTEPLDTVREGIPVGGSPLDGAEALQLDGAT